MNTRAVARWLRKKSAAWVLQLSEERKVHGVRVVVTCEDFRLDEDYVFQRMQEALDLLATYAPHFLRRMQHDLDLIWVRRHPMTRASYDGRLRACILDLPFFVANPEFTPAQVAASIVHEATHARLARAGVSYHEYRRDRVERICRKAELKFGKRIPDGGPVVERARSALSDDAQPYLSDHELREMHLRAAELRWEELRLPRWLKSLLGRIRKRNRAA
jgi:hypothetical protein